MKLSIVVPAYNEEAYLGACLDSIQAEVNARVDRGSVEILVIDNASTDRTPVVAAARQGVRVIGEPRKGLTRARQRGLEEARGEIVAYVDADSSMPPGWVGRMLGIFDHDQRVVCASGPYVYHDLPVLKSALVSCYWWLLAKPTYLLTRYMAVGGNFAANRSALRRIGGFDTSIAFFGEDTNIARRLSAVGRVAFDMRLVMRTSARRLRSDGFVRTAVRYAANFAAEVVLKRPLTSVYRDIR